MRSWLASTVADRRPASSLGPPKGEVLATVDGPKSAVSPGQAARSADVIAELVTRALGEIAQPGAVFPRVLYCGVAGTGRDEERRALHAALDAKELAEEVVIDSDGLIAMYDAFDDRAGILLVVGTGSIAYGRSPAGEIVRCGGWGPAFGDEGSGGWIGKRALGHCRRIERRTRAGDGSSLPHSGRHAVRGRRGSHSVGGGGRRSRVCHARASGFQHGRGGRSTRQRPHYSRCRRAGAPHPRPGASAIYGRARGGGGGA